MSHPFRLVPVALAAALMTACGGGGSDPSPAAIPTPSSGLAVDGYLSFSKVVCDANDNGVADLTEPAVFTTTTGRFTFPDACTHAVIVTGGTSADTNLPFSGQIKAPAGSTIASPLTTLLAAGLTSAQLATALGLPATTDFTKMDPAATNADGSYINPDLYKKTLAVQQILLKVTEVFAGLANAIGSATLQPLYAQVAASFASQLKSSGAVLGIGSGTSASFDAEVVKALTKKAAEDVAASSAVSSAVKAAVAAQNAAALSVATAATLKYQAEAILKSTTPADLVAATIAQQTDSKFTKAIVDNKGQLTGPPTAATIMLGNVIQAGVADPNTTSIQSNFMALDANSLSLVNGANTSNYTLDQFQSATGIALSWPLQPTSQIKLKIVENGNFTLAPNQRLNAAVQIEQTVAGGQGLLQGYIDNVIVTKEGSNLTFLMSNTGDDRARATSKVYGVSADGKTKATIDFTGAVRGVRNTLSTAAAAINTILVGDVVGYAVNQVSNDFTGINSIRGKYKVTIVVTDLPLRKLDGTQFKNYTINVPTKLNNATVSDTHPVSGPGIQGFITLTD